MKITEDVTMTPEWARELIELAVLAGEAVGAHGCDSGYCWT